MKRNSYKGTEALVEAMFSASQARVSDFPAPKACGPVWARRRTLNSSGEASPFA